MATIISYSPRGLPAGCRVLRQLFATGACVLLTLTRVHAMELDYNPPGRLVDIGHTRLHVHCTGEGSPTVIVDTGLGESALEWLPVQERLRHQSRTCLYDRAGYGWSEFGEMPRSSSRIVNELYMLLRNADIPGPYVLVGHSYGGMNMQLFARRYPYLVAGLVLVDSSTPEQIDRLTLPQLDAVDGLRVTRNGGIETTDLIARPIMPQSSAGNDGIDMLTAVMMSRISTMRTVANEYLNFKASARQVLRNAGRLPAVPVVVLSRGAGVAGPASDWQASNEDAWRRLQSQLANNAPRSAHIVALRSGHAIHAEQPELVVDAVTMVLDFARADRRWVRGGSSPRLPQGTTWLPFADAIWIGDRLHTAADVCPFGCSDSYFNLAIERAGHRAGTLHPAWERVPYRRAKAEMAGGDTPKSSK